jgi:hypothetical protein
MIFQVNPMYIFIRAIIFMVVFFGLGLGVRILVNNYFPELLYFEDEPAPQSDSFEPGQRINITLGNIYDYAVPEMYRNAPDAKELGNIEDLISGAFRPPAAPESRQEFRQEAPSEGIDRKPEGDYNVPSDDFGDLSGGSSDFSFSEPAETSMPSAPFGSLESSAPPAEPSEPAKPAPVEKPVFTPSFGDGTDDLEALPDLGSMAGAFSSSKDGGGEAAPFNLGGGGADFESAPPLGDIDPDKPADSPFASDTETYNKGNKAQPLEGDFDAQSLAQGIRTILAKEH